MSSRPPYPHPGSAPPTRPDDLYRTPPPWDIGRPQPALLALAQTRQIVGRVIDTGCGTGEHTLMAAEFGLDATGIDLAANALATAQDKAVERGLTARFLRHDARRLADLGEAFDTVLDCGLFHIFTGTDRTAYVDSLHAALRPGGRYFMLAFSDREPGPWPHKLNRDDIIAAFTDGWRLDSIQPATIAARTKPAGLQAWLTTLTRR